MHGVLSAGPPMFPCAGCLVCSLGEKLGQRQGEEIRQCSGTGHQRG